MKLIVVTNIIATIICINTMRAQIYEEVEIDTVTITAKAGFNANDFIDMVKSDTTFYKSFKNLKYYQHSSISKIDVFSKEDETKAGLIRESEHLYDRPKSWIDIKKETTKGKYYTRKGDYKYYTSEMFDYTFFPKDTQIVENNYVSEAYEQKEWDSRFEKHFEQLKKFVFVPGTPVEGVPIIGDKLGIYEEPMAQYYDFAIKKEFYKDSIDCYVFTVKVKEGVDEDDVVITYLETYYDRSSFHVVKRSYSMKHFTLLFDFDINIEVEINRIGEVYVPEWLTYDGWWDIPFKKPEIMKFDMKCSNYVIDH